MTTASRTKPSPRKRRTPEQARADILGAAENRLQKLGLEGLNVVGVAEDAGLSHAFTGAPHQFFEQALYRSVWQF